MPFIADTSWYLCARCLRERSGSSYAQRHSARRPFSVSPRLPQSKRNVVRGDDERNKEGLGTRAQEEKQGAMSRRLAEMSDESLETGGRSARKAVEEAGFNEDLKQQLEERLGAAQFREEHRSALAQAELPAGTGKGTRDIAAAEPWKGEESIEDAALRMLVDTRKPLKGPARIPSARGPPPKVDTARPKGEASSGARLASAREKTSYYAFMKDANMSEKERDQIRKELKERFTPAARAVPATIQGLASLANERIEDAIARGQFKNLPRGKVIERDYNASSPFLDTTEYFMNKIIQKQEIVPPWIEKQQELVATATRFRGRLRSDWKRHAARVIASYGGSLQEQIRRAESYAIAEAMYNPSKRKEEKLNAVDDQGHLSQITLAGELKVGVDQASSEAARSEITVTETTVEDKACQTLNSSSTPHQSSSPIAPRDLPDTSSSPSPPASTAPPQPVPSIPAPALFRDPTWERSEHSYHTLAITDLNSLTRSYNLMAPNIAKKPYFALDRELASCYMDVAPLIPQELRERAAAPPMKQARLEVSGKTAGGVLAVLGGEKARVYDETRPQYGFREFWREWFGGGRK
ncbi:MAG: hypothetical protein Q9165_000532 [Trypethelium subeluteriae]